MKNKFSGILRIQEWWAHILPPIVLFFYLGMEGQHYSALPTGIYAAVILLSICTAMTGYFLNDLFDMREDALAGKFNFVRTQPAAFRFLFIPVILTIFMCINLFLQDQVAAPVRQTASLLIGINLLLFILYSMPPVRLKSTPFGALILDALYSGTLFYAVAYLLSAGTNDLFNWFLLPVFAWGMLKGFRNYLNHTIEDADKDQISGQKTLTILHGKAYTLRVANAIYPVEIALLSLILFCKVPSIRIFTVILWLIFLLLWWRQYQKKANQPTSPLLNDLHEIWYPVLLLLSLVARQPNLFPFLIIHTILFPGYLNKLYFYTLFRLIGPIRRKNDDNR